MQTYKIRPSSVFLALFINLFVITAQADVIFNGGLWGREKGGELKEGGSFGISHYQVMLPVMKKQRERESTRIYSNFERQSIQWADNGNDYHWFSLPIFYQQQRNRITDLMIEFEPGIMTDFAKLGSDSLFANVLAKGRTRLSSDFDVHYGLTVNRRFGNADPYPVAQLQWYASRNTTVLLGFPDNRVQTDWDASLSSYIHISPRGGMWRESSKDKSKQGLASYQNWRLGVGAKMRWRNNFWFIAEVGQNFNRKFSAFDESGQKQGVDINDSYYWQIGLRLIL